MRAINRGVASVFVLAAVLQFPSATAAAPANFFTTTPCRVFDSRSTDAPSLAHGTPRLVQITGLCTVPINASSVAVNMTAITPSVDGDLVLYPGDESAPAPPRPGAMPFKAGLSRAKIGIIELGAAGDLNALATMSSGAIVDVTLDVMGYFVNDIAPTAVADSATVAEDASATAIDVLANDTDPDGGPKAISSTSDPTNGTVVLTGGSPGQHTGLTYQPDLNYCNSVSGPLDTFTYTLTPGGSTATVSVTVTCVEDDPTAVDDSATVAEDAAATTIAVLANDTDPDGGAKTIASATDPANGTVVIAGDNLSLTYQPNAEYCNDPSGTPDTFDYTLTQGGSTGTVSVTVTCAGDDPTAVNDSVTVAEDASATTIDVLANDTDPDGGAKTIASATDPANGTVVIAGDTLSLTYQPDPGYCNSVSGPLDTFTYTLSPGGSTATVSVTVTCLDDDPTAVADSATVNEDAGATTINVLANDTDPDGGTKTIASATDPANGTVVIAGDNLSLTYQPDPNYCNSVSGPLDTFTYTLSPGGSSTTVSVTVTCVDDNPVAVVDSATVTEDASATTIAVLANDTDADGGTKTIASATDPANGTVVIAGDTLSLTYQPDANYCNSVSGPLDTFNYTLNGGSSTTVSVTVTCVDDNPTAVADSATVNEDASATTINVLSNDTDPDGGTKTIASATDPANGTVAIAGDNLSLTYQPDPNYCNSVSGPLDTFNYTLNGGSSTTVSVTVTCIDDAPVAVDDLVTVNEDSGASTLAVQGNDTDIDGGPKSVATVSDPPNGTAAVVSGNAVYTPDPNYCNGLTAPSATPDTFTYTLTPGGDTGSVSVTVICINDPPTVVNESFQVIGNTELRVDMTAGTTPHASETTAGASSYEGVLDNDGDPEGDTVSVTAVGSGCSDPAPPFDCTLTSGAVVHVDANGEFSFTPGPGDTSDSFQYTVTDQPAGGGALSATGTVSFTFFEIVWYVDNDAPAGNGTSSSPFNALSGTNLADTSGDGDLTDDLDDASDYIFVHFGNGTSTGQATGLQLEAGQHLLGEHAGLSIPVNLNTNGSPTVLHAGSPGSRPLLTNAAGSAVFATDVVPVEIVGLSLSSTTLANTNAIDWTTTGAFSGAGTLTIRDNVVTGATAEGVDVNLAGSGATGLAFHDNNLTATGTALDVAETGTGSLTIGRFDDNVVSGATGGSAISIVNATFDGTPTGSFQTVSGGTTVIGAAGVGNGVGGNGVVMSGVAGDLTFTDLDIFADGGAGLAVTGTGAVNTGAGTGTRVTVGAGVGIIEATGGPALSLNGMTADFQLTTLKSTNSASSGVSLTNVADGTTVSTISAGSSSSISNASTTDFAISGGNATVTYNGTITDDVGQVVSVASATGDTISFTGAITDGDDGDGSGVALTGNGATTINFHGGLILNTGGNAAFAATGGGTVNVCDESPCNPGATGALINKLTTTTATALNVANTTIGASNLEFRSISSNGGSANGIILSTTGSSGGLKVKGTGSAGSGGTIANKTGSNGSSTDGTGIYLNSTSGVSFDRMQLNDFQNYAIRGLSVTGFSLTNSVVNGANGTTNAGPNEEDSLRFDDLFTSGAFPTAQVTGSSISGGFTNNLRVRNVGGTLNRLMLTNDIFGLINAANGNDNVNITAVPPSPTLATLHVTLEDSTFLGTRGDFFETIADGNSTMDVVARENKFTNGQTIIPGGGVALSIRGDVAGTADNVTFDLSCNNIVGGHTATGIFVAKGNGAGSWSGSIVNNPVGAASGAGGDGIFVRSAGSGTISLLIQNNQVTGYGNVGYHLQNNDGSATMNATIFGNTVTAPHANAFAGLFVDNGATATDSSKANVVVGSAGVVANKNELSAGDPANFSDVSLSNFNASTTFSLSRNGSANSTAAQIIADDNLNPATTNTDTSGGVGTITATNTLPTVPATPAGCVVPP